jgi:hypothetical protein
MFQKQYSGADGASYRRAVYFQVNHLQRTQISETLSCSTKLCPQIEQMNQRLKRSLIVGITSNTAVTVYPHFRVSGGPEDDSV